MEVEEILTPSRKVAKVGRDRRERRFGKLLNLEILP